MADADTEIFLDLLLCSSTEYVVAGRPLDGYSQLSIGRISHTNPDISIISFGKIKIANKRLRWKSDKCFGSRTDLRQNMDDRRQITGICRCSGSDQKSPSTFRVRCPTAHRLDKVAAVFRTIAKTCE